MVTHDRDELVILIHKHHAVVLCILITDDNAYRVVRGVLGLEYILIRLGSYSACIVDIRKFRIIMRNGHEHIVS